MHHSKHRSWRYLTIATIVFFLGAGIWFFILPIQQSKQLEHSVIDRFGWATRYTPPADGDHSARSAGAFYSGEGGSAG